MISYVLGTVLVTGNKEMDKTHEDPALMQFMFKRQQTENKKYKTQNTRRKIPDWGREGGE